MRWLRSPWICTTSPRIFWRVCSPPAPSGLSPLHLEGEKQTILGVWRILHEMVYNLCDNAIKYNKDGGSVTVQVTGEAERVTLAVKDTGIGIPKGAAGPGVRAVLPGG